MLAMAKSKLALAVFSPAVRHILDVVGRDGKICPAAHQVGLKWASISIFQLDEVCESSWNIDVIQIVDSFFIIVRV